MIRVEDLALQRDRYADMTDAEFRFMLQQIDGRQRTIDKLPTFHTLDDWWYPIRLSCEQCSSESTAIYKSQLLHSTFQNAYTLTDLTGGYGVDIFFMSKYAAQAHYIEQNEELFHIVQHNFALHRPAIQMHNIDAVAYLQSMSPCDVIYIDPARRNKLGNKVFFIEDCEPNIINLLPTIRNKSKRQLIKLSPMLDITAALRSISGIWDVHVVAIDNEVKEILLFSHSCEQNQQPQTYAVNILTNQNSPYDTFVFNTEEEKVATCNLANNNIEQLTYLYEPNSSIIKAGAFRLVAQRFGLSKLDVNTHLYASNKFVKDFPGRIWKLISTGFRNMKDPSCQSVTHAAVLTRNYPLNPMQLRRKLKLYEGDEYYVIGARVQNHPTLFLAQRIK